MTAAETEPGTRTGKDVETTERDAHTGKDIDMTKPDTHTGKGIETTEPDTHTSKDVKTTEPDTPAGKDVKTTEPHTHAGKATDIDTPSTSGPLLPRKERDTLNERLHHALTGFVDEPRGAVSEAEAVLQEAAESLARRLAERGAVLRGSYADGDTEHLRTALRDYRDLLERIASV